MSFEQLIKDLDDLQKAGGARKPAPEPLLEPDDLMSTDEGNDKIMDAADPEDADEARDLAETEIAPKKKPTKKSPQPPEEDDEGIEPLGKAFAVTLESGDTVEAYDATLVLKSFDDRLNNLDIWTAQRSDAIEQLRTEVQALTQGYADDRANLETLLRTQASLIKSLSEQITVLGTTPRDRKSVLNVHERPVASTGTSPTVTVDDLMTKAMAAQRNGHLTSFDIARLEATTARGIPPPADILKALQF